MSPSLIEAEAATAAVICKRNRDYVPHNSADRAKFRNAFSAFNNLAKKSGADQADVAALFGRNPAKLRDIEVDWDDSASRSISYSNGTIKIRRGHFNAVVVPHELGHQYGLRHGINAGGTNQHRGPARGYAFRAEGKGWYTLMRTGYAPSGSKYMGRFSNPNQRFKGVPSGKRNSYDCAAQLRRAAGPVSRRDNRR